MPRDSTRILAVGDMHLGRAPARVHAALDQLGRQLGSLDPGAAWQRAVDAALEHAVDAVLLAGDIVDSENARFEAWGALQRGVQRLAAVGIPVLAVAGNHDAAVLPRLAGQLEGLTFLGRGGVWEAQVIGGGAAPGAVTGSDLAGADGAGPLVEIVGWSFPTRVVEHSPLATPLPPARSGAVARLGLLHADLDVPGSRYAPVTRAELAAAGLDAWLLGHIHTPAAADALARPGYLGSLVGLDPTETGRHGPWLVTVAGDGTLSREHLSLAPLRWEAVGVAVDGWRAPSDDLDQAVLAKLRATLAEVSGETSGPVVVGVSLELTGRCDRFWALEAAVRDLGTARTPGPDGAAIPVHDDGTSAAFLADIRSRVRTAWNLAELARAEDPPGLLARRLLALGAGGAVEGDGAPDGATGNFGAANAAGLVDEAVARLEERAASPQFQPLGVDAVSREEARERLVRAGLTALDRLLRQREDAGAAP